MIELMEIMVVVFPQAVGIAVMKVKSFGLMVEAIETRVEVIETKIYETETMVYDFVTKVIEIAKNVIVWIASLPLAMTEVEKAIT
jgi:Mg2+ and Co2+ transporter CorA